MQVAINGQDFWQSGTSGFSSGQHGMPSAIPDIDMSETGPDMDMSETGSIAAPLADTAKGPAMSPTIARIGSNLRSQMPTFISPKMPQTRCHGKEAKATATDRIAGCLGGSRGERLSLLGQGMRAVHRSLRYRPASRPFRDRQIVRLIEQFVSKSGRNPVPPNLLPYRCRSGPKSALEGKMCSDPNCAHGKELPSWFVDDLGPLGVPYSKMEDFAVPPEESHGALFLPDRLEKGYHVAELKDGVYWVTSGWYDCLFVRTGSGVVAIDAPPALGENLLEAIESVTDEPVTHMIYSHWHADHVGAASVFGPKIERIGHDKTRELLERFPDRDRPPPLATFSRDETLDVGGVKFELSYKGQNHCEGNIFIYLPQTKILTAIDIASPGWTTFRDCDSSESLSGYADAFDKILEYDFDLLISGHVSKTGGRADVEEGREYMHDVMGLAREALETIPIEYFLKQIENTSYRAAFRWAEESYFNALTNYVTKQMLTKTTSNGKKWSERLNGADVMAKHNAYYCIEKTRLEMSHNGYVKRGNIHPPKFFG